MVRGSFTWLAAFLALTACVADAPTAAEVPVRVAAFPGAEGFGRETIGGRGGAVFIIETLADSGPGSLRAAVEADGPRMVVFAVSGTIELESPLVIRNDFITIAGQSAPGDGITLKNHPLIINAHEVVVRHLRSRPGAEAGEEMDAVTIEGGRSIVLDHVSASWSTDETLSISQRKEHAAKPLDLITVQWSIIAQSLNTSVHSKGEHGYGSLLRAHSGARISFHHNLWAHHRARMPRPGNFSPLADDPVGPVFAFSNNVLYNWGGRSAGYNADTGSISRYDFIANAYVRGPSSTGAVAFQESCPVCPGHFSGNTMNGSLPDDPFSLYECKAQECLRSPQPVAEDGRSVEPAPSAFDRTLAFAGAFPRDSVDVAIVADVRSGTGRIIDDPAEVGGWPELASHAALPDRDHDGIADAWEVSNGLDPQDSRDASRLSKYGYTALETYLQALADARIEQGSGLDPPDNP